MKKYTKYHSNDIENKMLLNLFRRNNFNNFEVFFKDLLDDFEKSRYQFIVPERINYGVVCLFLKFMNDKYKLDNGVAIELSDNCEIIKTEDHTKLLELKLAETDGINLIDENSNPLREKHVISNCDIKKLFTPIFCNDDYILAGNFLFEKNNSEYSIDECFTCYEFGEYGNLMKISIVNKHANYLIEYICDEYQNIITGRMYELYKKPLTNEEFGFDKKLITEISNNKLDITNLCDSFIKKYRK